MKSIWMRIRNKFLLLSIFPIYFFITYWIVGNLRGEFYLNPNNDPSYAYLGNALNLATFQVPFHTDHPGTPVQILGAIILRFVFFLRQIINLTSFQFTDDIFRYSELYLKLMSLTFLGTCSVSLLLLGIITFILSLDIFLALILQINTLFILHIAQLQFFPEILLFAASQTVVALAIISFYRQEILKSFWFPIALGFVLGLGMAIKVTFVPMLTFILLLSRLSGRLTATACTALSFILFTLPIAPQYPRVFSWLSKLITQQGGYGAGEFGLQTDIIPYLSNLFFHQPIFFLVYYFAVILVAYISFLFLVRRLRITNPGFDKIQTFQADPKISRSFTLLILVVIAFLGQCALTLFERVGGVRYFVPSMAIFQLLLFALFIFITTLVKERFIFSNLKVLKSIFLCFCIAISVISISKLGDQFNKNYKIITEDVLALENVQHSSSYEGCTLIQGVGSHRPSTHDSALDFLNYWAGSYWDSRLDKLYPQFLRIDGWDISLVSSFGAREISSYRFRDKLEKVMHENECVLLRYSYNGYSTDIDSVQYQAPEMPEGVELQEIFHGRLEGLDRIVLSKANVSSSIDN